MYKDQLYNSSISSILHIITDRLHLLLVES